MAKPSKAITENTLTILNLVADAISDRSLTIKVIGPSSWKIVV